METIGIPLLCTMVGLGISYSTFNKNSKKDAEESARRDAERKMQLDYIQKGIDDIRFHDRLRDEQLKNMNDRLIIVESETKVLSKTVNKLEGYHDGRDENKEKGE